MDQGKASDRRARAGSSGRRAGRLPGWTAAASCAHTGRRIQSFGRRRRARIAYLTTIDFGRGELAALPAALGELVVERPLLVSGRGLAANGLLDLCRPHVEPAAEYLDRLKSGGGGGRGSARRVAGGRCDGIVALGGGSPIDLAKGVALLATHPGPLAPYAVIEGGLERITGKVAPVIAIPTTAGTGAEVGRAALLTLDDGRKFGLNETAPR